MARKRQRMTDKWRCRLLIEWLRRRGISFRLHQYTEYTPSGRKRVARSARGQAEAFAFRGRMRIRLWAPADGFSRGWRDLTNTIIHEYGHLVLRRTPHTEREAWTFGRRSVPARYVPENYGYRRISSLATYGQAADRRQCWKHANK